jgi:hypothetical protein
MSSGESRVESGELKVENVKWRLNCSHHYACFSGECKMKSGKCKVESVKWRVESV